MQRFTVTQKVMLMQTTENSAEDNLIVRRPHFRLVENTLYFLISRRPHAQLSSAEVALWNAIEGEISVAALRKLLPQELDPTLQRLVALGVCDVVSTTYKKDRRRVLVFEPHSDDAVLSVGATIWLRRHECEFIIVTIGSQSNFTSYYNLERDYFDVDQISTLRDAEGNLFARFLGGQHRSLGQLEATLRYQPGSWSLDWYRRHKFSVSAFIAHRSGEEELRSWTETIRVCLSKERADEVWFPLGSPHTDHELTRDAFLRLLVSDQELFSKREVRLYQDVPYAARFPSFTPTALEALRRAGATLELETVTVTSAFSQKFKLLSLYASQFKLDAIRSDVQASARIADHKEEFVERFWHLKKAPENLRMFAGLLQEAKVNRFIAKLVPWLRKHRHAKRIRLLLVVPAGRWTEDIACLFRTFPEATFDAYVAEGAAAEVYGFNSSRIHLHDVTGGTKAWLLLALQLLVKSPAPTLFVSGEKRFPEAKMLSALWITSDTVVVPSMDDLIAGVRATVSEATAEK